MSAQITPPEKNSIEDVFWLIAIHYQILQVLKPDPKRSVEVSNEVVVTTNPNRSVPEKAYSPVKVKKCTYTLDDLLAQVPEDTTQCEDLEAEPVNRNCNTDPSPTRSIPEEAYSPAKFRKSTHTLDDLLAQVTEDNLPDEVNADPSMENEA